MFQGTIIFNSPQKPKLQGSEIGTIQFKVIKGVLDHDFPQAKRAWEALEEAGINPGELVANGLREGHSYEVIFYQSTQPINSSSTNLLSESKISDQALVEYKKSDNSMQAAFLIDSKEQSTTLVKANKSSEEYIQIIGIVRKRVNEIKDLKQESVSLLQEG